MFEKVFGYILSLRRQKRLHKLELIHKMPDSEPLQKALAYCEFYARYPSDEPTVNIRIKQKVMCNVPNIDELDDELMRIAEVILEENKQNKYYERLPGWTNAEGSNSITLDELLQTSSYSYYSIGSAIETIGHNLKRIQEGIEKPHNEKMKSYYLKKPGVVYREAVNILRQII